MRARSEWRHVEAGYYARQAHVETAFYDEEEE